MDGAKNLCPSFARSPKAAEEELKDALKLHVVGLIFHHNPDVVHLFYAGPHLSGNSNLNIECMYRAMLHEYKEKGMLSTLHCQFDNASDNKSRWCLGFFGLLVKLRIVNEVRVSMMMVGHTHEDIDAIFQLISAAWKRARQVLSPSAFTQLLSDAVPNCIVHDFLEYVHDWASFFADCIYDEVVGINTAREFIIRERDDGVVAFWYKPSSSHKHLYPALKDNDGNPIQSIVNGSICYTPDPMGIEVFRTTDDLATTVPKPAEFARAVADSQAMRFDVDAAEANLKKIIAALPQSFSQHDVADWKSFFAQYPRSVKDIPQNRLHAVEWDAIPPTSGVTALSSLSRHTVSACVVCVHKPRTPCSMHLLCPSLCVSQELYAESIAYTNPVSGASVGAQQLRNLRADSREVPVLKKDDIILVFPAADVIQASRVAPGEKLPFWVCKLIEDEDAELDQYGLRRVPSTDTDKFQIAWLGVFDAKHKITNSVTGIWRLRCAHSNNRVKVHPWSAEKCCAAPHSLMVDTIERASILLYDVEFTEGGRLNEVSKTQIVQTLSQLQNKSALFELLPKTWKKTTEPVSLRSKKGGKGKGRRR